MKLRPTGAVLRRSLLTLALALSGLALGLPAPDAAAQAGCDRSGCGRASCATPARPVPEDRWGELQPVDVALPLCSGVQGPAFCRDSTAFNEFSQAYSAFPWFMSLDVENGYVLTALSHGLQVWDARTAPQNPEPLSQLPFQAFPVWSDNAELKWPLQDVDAPSGGDRVAAIVGQGGIGIAIVDLADKEEPAVVYQNHRKDGEQVYAATINGRQYAFLAASSGQPTGGLFAYDMTRALDLDGCVEAVPAPGEAVQCPGVYLGKIGSRGSALFVDGVDRFVAVSFGAARGVEIWDAGSPASPQLKLSGLGDRGVDGVAMWRQGSSYFLAARTSFFDAALGRAVNATSIWDVSCVTGTCGPLGNPIWSGEFTSLGTRNFLTFSRSGDRRFLYLGSDNRCAGGEQREWLLDVTNAAAPRDITPPAGYWGWYYRGGPTGFNLVMPRTGQFSGEYFYRAGLSIFDIHRRTDSTGGPRPVIGVNGPQNGSVGQALTFSAAASGCTPDPAGWIWSTAGGTVTGPATAGTIQITWEGTGEKTVSARNSACGSAVGGRTVNIANNPGGGNALVARFTFSPLNPRPGQSVAFNAGTSGGNPTQYVWDFGDGTTGLGQTPAHTYPNAGNYTVRLTVSRPGTGPGCISGTCFSETFGVVVVSDNAAPLDSSFQTSATCFTQFGFEQCSAAVGAAVSLTANEARPGVTYTWNFGDGSTATGRTVSHTFTTAGEFPVNLTVSQGGQSATSSKFFRIGGDNPNPNPPNPVVGTTFLLPQIAQTQGGLVQTSDLYIHNPGSAAMTVALEFRKRGAPENPPPRATRTIPARATLFLEDVLGSVFNRPNTSGFLTVRVENGNALPVITSFNTTFGPGGALFGQTIPALVTGGSAAPQQHLVGLNDDAQRLAYFGVDNPNPQPATYRLRFFNRQGQEIRVSEVFTLAAFSQRQFQARDIRGTLGVSGTDYRVVVEALSGGRLYAYGSNLRLATQDPSFVESAVVSGSGQAWLVGALNTPGLQGSLFQTDLVLANPTSSELRVSITFQNVGPLSQREPAIEVAIPGGQTVRLADVIEERWDLDDGIGTLVFTSLSPGGLLPVIQGESYDNARPNRRFGQSMTPFTLAGAARPNESHHLVGLRQDSAYRTTFWIYNPEDSVEGRYDLIYRGLDGAVLGRLDNVRLGAGKMRQIRPSDHPLPGGVAAGFSVEVAVRAGSVMSAAQVVQNQTNDPAYIKGEKRAGN